MDFAEVWFKSVDHITFHDPLAAVDLFHSDVLTYEAGEIVMDLSDGMRVLVQPRFTGVLSVLALPAVCAPIRSGQALR